MFNWLSQLFGKTDYKKLKKELENEIQQRKFEDINRVHEKIKQRKHAK